MAISLRLSSLWRDHLGEGKEERRSHTVQRCFSKGKIMSVRSDVMRYVLLDYPQFIVPVSIERVTQKDWFAFRLVEADKLPWTVLKAPTPSAVIVSTLLETFLVFGSHMASLFILLKHIKQTKALHLPGNSRFCKSLGSKIDSFELITQLKKIKTHVNWTFKTRTWRVS